MASLSTNTGTPSRSLSTWRSGTSGERHVDRGDDASGLELDDRGHADARRRSSRSSRTRGDHRDELIDQRVGARQVGRLEHRLAQLADRAASPRRPWCRRDRRRSPSRPPRTELRRGRRRASSSTVTSSASRGQQRRGHVRVGRGVRTERGGDRVGLATRRRPGTRSACADASAGERQRDPRDERLEPRLRDADDQPRALRQRLPDRGTAMRCGRRGRSRAAAGRTPAAPRRAARARTRRRRRRARARPASGAPLGAGGAERIEQRLAWPSGSSSARRRAARSAHRRTRRVRARPTRPTRRRARRRPGASMPPVSTMCPPLAAADSSSVGARRAADRRRPRARRCSRRTDLRAAASAGP